MATDTKKRQTRQRATAKAKNERKRVPEILACYERASKKVADSGVEYPQPALLPIFSEA